MGNKSASEVLHDLLMMETVGFKFTMQTLKDMVAEAGMEVTQGAVTGFIHRAARLGRVQVVGKVKGNQGRMLYQYEIVNREPWSFKEKSLGSPKGRKIGERHYNPVPTAEPEEEVPIQHKHWFSLSDRLLSLSIEVAELEKKSLKDYSTDELIAELKRRVK